MNYVRLLGCSAILVLSAGLVACGSASPLEVSEEDAAVADSAGPDGGGGDATKDAKGDGADVTADVTQDTPTDPVSEPFACASGKTLCGDGCVDLLKDPSNCGACGTACTSEQVCSKGVCALGCFGGTTECKQGNSSICADLQTDPEHCGVCGHGCGGSEMCKAGQCAIACQSGQVLCDGACVDPLTSQTHCGASGTCTGALAGVACGAGQVCDQGACALSCQPGLQNCGGKCVDTSSDHANCGSCTNACPADQVCTAGTCALVCPTGTTNCGGSCTVTAFDPNNCGVCSNVCPSAPQATAVCSAGTCSTVCAASWQNCNMSPLDGCEIDTSTDPLNCGLCSHACPSGAHASASCAAMLCGLACESGWGNCDLNSDNGCEVDLANDPLHCSKCGEACPSAAHAWGVCTSSACSIACDPGFSDCNASALDGCESDLAADPKNCSACGKACSTNHATPSCSNGVCGVAACANHWGNCNNNPADGCETDLLNSKSNCGSCGHNCLLFCYNGGCI